MGIFEDQFKSLDLSDESKRQSGDEEIPLHFNKDGQFDVAKSYSKEKKDALEALNKLIEINAKKDLAGVDIEIRALSDQVTPFIKSLNTCDLSKEVKSFLQIVSLVTANYTVNDFIKSEIDVSLIDKMLAIYLSIIETLRSSEFEGYNYLLTRTSLISPLLITISFSFKLETSASPSLIKTLAILFTYLMKDASLFDTVVKLFAVNSTTNIEMFQVFNKLWEKTLEIPAESQLNINQSTGPVSIINRIDALEIFQFSEALVNHVFPFIPSQYLYKLSQSSLTVYSNLTNIKNGSEISSNVCELLESVTTDLSSEVILVLIETLDVTDTLLKLFEDEQYQPQLGYVFAKISQFSYLKQKNTVALQLLSKTLSKGVIHQLESSAAERYKVLFELLDHNTKIDFSSDFTMAFSTEKALYFIDRDFDMKNDHQVLSELGSSLSLPAIFIYTSFLLSKALLKFTNSTKSPSLVLEEKMGIRRLPPLPKSDFLDYENSYIPKGQQNLKNSRLVTDSLSHCLSILHKTITSYSEIKDWIHPIQDVEDTDDDLEYQAVDRFLVLNYSAYFTILNTCNELLQKSKGYKSDHYSPYFHDLSSISHVLKLQTFQVFYDLFQFYDSFALYKLVKFIMKVSMTDLELQKFSVKILDHIIFHSSNALKDSIKGNELIRKLLQQFVVLWNDGSVEYKPFEIFLGLKPITTELVAFDATSHLNLLGFAEPKLVASNSSPGTSSSSSSIHNYSYANNSNSFNNGLHTNLSTPNNTGLISSHGNKSVQQFTNNSSGYFNTNSNNNQYNLNNNSPGTPLSAGAIDYSNYRNSIIRNVQSFIPQTQPLQPYNNSGSNTNRAQSIHVDQFGR